MSNKPQNVVSHWHYFPQGMTESDDFRIDICQISEKPAYIVWILETDISIHFWTFNDAKIFVKDFILGRHAKPAVDMNDDPI
jgi:hypothetical protein